MTAGCASSASPLLGVVEAKQQCRRQLVGRLRWPTMRKRRLRLSTSTHKKRRSSCLLRRGSAQSARQNSLAWNTAQGSLASAIRCTTSPSAPNLTALHRGRPLFTPVARRRLVKARGAKRGQCAPSVIFFVKASPQRQQHLGRATVRVRVMEMNHLMHLMAAGP